MKALIVGRAGQFNKTTGSGIPRYMYELYKNIKKFTNIKVEKREFFSIPYISKHFPFTNNSTFMFRTMLSNFTDYDLVHNPDPSNMIFNYKLRNTKLVTTVHDFIPILEIKKFYNKDQKGDQNKIKLLLFKLNFELNNAMTSLGMYHALHKSDSLIAVSSQTKEDAEKLGYNGKIYITNEGIDPRFIKKKSTKDNNKFQVGYIGGFGPRKNLNFLLKAWKSLGEKYKMDLCIWGNKTFESNTLFKKINDKSIKVKGFAPEKELVDIYDSFNIFVFPSLYEGFGLPILEAQARGLPVVIYKYSKIPKEVRKYCFEAVDEHHFAQIILSIKENGYNDKLKKKATGYARSFTWEKTAKQTLNAYEKILIK